MKENKKKLNSLQRSSIGGTIKGGDNNFYNVPEGTASNLVMEVLGAGRDLGGLPERKRQVNHTQQITVREKDKVRQIELSTKKESVMIELSDIDKLVGSNKPVKKMFVLALIKANEQAIHNGQLTSAAISFPLQELIELGFYKTEQSARRGFKAGMDVLTSLKLKGRVQSGKNKESSIESLRVLFTGSDIKNNQCTIYMNEFVNWGFIAQYFTIMPRYYFRLPNRASDLLYYIFYLARQRVKDIAEKGYFNISFRSIQARLNLPSENHTINPGRDIKEAIESAIQSIEDTHAQVYEGLQFTLTPIYDENASIADFLDNGYLKVGMDGIFAETFIELNNTKVKGITAAQKRTERIIEDAVAKKLAKKMEAEEDTEDNT